MNSRVGAVVCTGAIGTVRPMAATYLGHVGIVVGGQLRGRAEARLTRYVGDVLDGLRHQDPSRVSWSGTLSGFSGLRNWEHIVVRTDDGTEGSAVVRRACDPARASLIIGSGPPPF